MGVLTAPSQDKSSSSLQAKSTFSSSSQDKPIGSAPAAVADAVFAAAVFSTSSSDAVAAAPCTTATAAATAAPLDGLLPSPLARDTDADADHDDVDTFRFLGEDGIGIAE